VGPMGWAPMTSKSVLFDNIRAMDSRSSLFRHRIKTLARFSTLHPQ
jgi:hypothetical protein